VVTPLPDAAARERIASDTATTLFVEAGAGSGKTAALIDRVVTLVLDDGVALGAIAAVTFTEKAGAELRDRLREAFEAVWRPSSSEDDVRRSRAADALDDLDGPAIGTLHSFAQRILSEHPIEAGIPPLIEVLDEVASSVAFEERWAGLQQELLDSDELEEPLLLGMASGVKLDHLRSIARLLGAEWDLIADRVLVGNDHAVAMPDVTDLVSEAARVAARASECRDPDDRLLAKLAEIEQFGVLLSAAPDAAEQLAVLQSVVYKRFGVGRQANWPDVGAVRGECEALVERAGSVVSQILDACLRRLTRFIAFRVLDAAQERRAEGRLEFHDLLVLARDLLRRDASVRAALHERYQRLLLDEFQDTDPIQIELAVRIASGASGGAEQWQDVAVPDGRLFVVGDPKQSIYRFRRASIATYLDAHDRLGETVQLSTNFRTTSPLVTWVNQVFGALIQPVPGGQPSYQPLDADRLDAANGPTVTVLGAEPHDGLPRAAAAILREREAADVAAVIRRAITDRWQVWDRRSERWRDAELHDVAVLVPARTSLPFLEDALDAAGVPYRAEASSLVYQAQEVRDLLACSRAVADTSDTLSLVAALRSPLFGCGDDDLWRWKQAGGAFNVFAVVEDFEGPVATSLEYLRELYRAARWLTPSETLGLIIADRRMLEVAATGPRARDAWRRLRFVVDQARAWSEVSHGGVRAYLAWAAHQGQEASRVAEAVLPETDTDAVRVMTIHAAKGLEFPIVVMSGTTSQPGGARGVRILWQGDRGYEVKLGRNVQTDDFDAVAPIDEQMDDLEKRRLLYVAATRARDHLVVSVHRSATSKSVTNAKLLAEAGAASDADRFAAPPVVGDVAAIGVSASGAVEVPEFAAWLESVSSARAASRVKPVISASGLEGTEPEVALPAPSVDAPREGRAKGARNLELPPWAKGRYGTAIGRAVHGVLQVIDLATGDEVDDAVAAQCVAEGVVDYADLVRGLVRSALDSDVVQRAAVREHWRESYVAAVQGDGTMVEGFVDLIYREDDGSLVILDYKTDAVPAEALAARATFYAPQLEAYRDTVSTATDAIVDNKLVFLRADDVAAVRAFD
jgi:ATP-dependent helicase/nuclease subunit A